MKFKVGDEVIIKNSGKCYETYCEFFKEHNIIDLGLKYAYSNSIHNYNFNNKKYIVEYVGKHNNGFDNLVVISSNDDFYSPTYLIGEEGLEFYKRKMTIEEIEKELGYKIQLIQTK